MVSIKQLFFIGLVLVPFLSHAQKINRDNPSYMEVDNDFITSFIDWPFERSQDVYFQEDSIPTNAQLMPLRLVRKGMIGSLRQFNKLNAFVVDTNEVNLEGAYRFYGNPKVFDTLIHVNASMKSKGEYKIADLNDSVASEIKDWGSFLKGMLYLEVIGTYSHLSSEMITTDIEETSESFTIDFKVVWHYCTNDCYDPKYKFSLQVDKKIGVITMLR